MRRINGIVQLDNDAENLQALKDKAQQHRELVEIASQDGGWKLSLTPSYHLGKASGIEEVTEATVAGRISLNDWARLRKKAGNAYQKALLAAGSKEQNYLLGYSRGLKQGLAVLRHTVDGGR